MEKWIVDNPVKFVIYGTTIMGLVMILLILLLIATTNESTYKKELNNCRLIATEEAINIYICK